MTKVCIGIAGLLAVLMIASGCGGGKINSYSADQIQIKNGKVEATTKMYVTPDKIRMESPSPEGKGDMVMIFRKEDKKMYMILPEKKKYFETDLSEEDLEKKLNMFKDDSEDVKVLGKEKVNGYNCTKKEVETEVGFMGFNRKVKMTIWMSDQFEFPIKTESTDGSVNEMKNIKPGKQPKKLFEPPKDYTKVNNMFELMM